MAIGKTIGRRIYLHRSACDLLDEKMSAFIAQALAAVQIPSDGFNVLRIEFGSQSIAFLDYPGFFDKAFPVLARSWNVRVDTGDWSYRSYAQSLNPPILHRKELLLRPDDPHSPDFAALTSALETLGFFDDPVRIGFQSQWNALLRGRGFQVLGHQLVPIGNDESDSGLPIDMIDVSIGIARHLTALTRTTLSAPVQLLHKHGFLDATRSLFDYGCGRGSDLRGLNEMGLRCSGWDPYFSPETDLVTADIVNLGFVINVIEDPVERRDALLGAWTLTRQLLVVSTMIASEHSTKGTPYADGIITGRRTFQKYYTQQELREYLASTLGSVPVSVAPGVFFVFRDEVLEQRFQSGRYRSRLRLFPRRVPAASERPPRPVRAPRPTVYEQHKALIDAIWNRALDLGRDPIDEEVPQQAEIRAAIGSPKRALNIAARQHDPALLNQARQQRTDDRAVFFALQEFERRPPYKHLEAGLQRDVRHFFGDYKAARVRGQELLREAADPDILERACNEASEKGLGFLTPHKSLELHISLVARLAPVLRVYVGCATLLDDDQPGVDLVKIHIHSGKVSFMKYNNFDRSPLPRLLKRTKVNLRTQAVQTFAYGKDFEPPILYLKSRYMNEEEEHYPLQLRFDEELQTLVDLAGHGPSLRSLAVQLRQSRKSIKGFRIVPSHALPNLDDPCGRFFTYRQLIQCGETQARLKLGNQPEQGETYTALHDLATWIIDPAVEYFGSIELTYGFCSQALASEIHGRIAPALDQHAAHELKKSGGLICSRKGAAVDFLVRDEDMRGVADWVIANLPFDRLYYYGPTRPLHVSYGPENARKAYEMVQSRRGTLIPRTFKAAPQTTDLTAPASLAGDTPLKVEP
jgi:DNA phosphorothioation-associated putative methyltransferase